MSQLNSLINIRKEKKKKSKLEEVEKERGIKWKRKFL